MTPTFLDYVNSSTSTVRVLIADDDRDVIDALSALFELERPNYVTDTAVNANGVLRAISQREPDILLLDIKLGMDNGLELLEKIKKIAPDITTIVMTAYRDADLAATAVRLGANDYFHKPINPERFLENISRNIDAHMLRKEMREANRRFRLIFDISPQLLLLVDGSGNVNEINSTTRRYIKNSDRDIRGAPLESVNWREDIPIVSKRLVFLKEAAKKNIRNRIEMKLTRDDRLVRNIEFQAFPVVQKDASSDRILIEGRDVTERVEAEEFLRKANAILDKKVHERTVELEYAKDLAEAGNKAKSEFLAKMNHELRTPLNAVLGFAQLMSADESVSKLNREFADHIYQAGRHLLYMVNEVLQLSEVDKGNIDLSVEKVHVHAIVEESIQALSSMANESDVIITNNIDKNAEVVADQNHLRQIITILLRNAVKYNRKHGTVTVQCEKIGSSCAIKVIDTGIGIHADDLQWLFQPFVKLPHHQHVDGIGIGLTIVRRLIEAMHGTVNVQSEYGHGSCFAIELPCS